jgi:hypothetical protein
VVSEYPDTVAVPLVSAAVATMSPRMSVRFSVHEAVEIPRHDGDAVPANVTLRALPWVMPSKNAVVEEPVVVQAGEDPPA